MSKPKPGCLLLIVVGVVFALLAVWAGFAGHRQNQEIDRFTVATPVELPGQPSAPEQVAALRARVREFGASVKANKPARLEITGQEINDLIGHEDKLFDYRPIIRVTAITDALETRVAMPLKTLFRGGKLRYWNGTMKLRPSVKDSLPIFEATDLTSDSGLVPAGFAGSFAANFVPHAAFREDEAVAPVLRRITHFGVEQGKLVLEKK